MKIIWVKPWCIFWGEKAQAHGFHFVKKKFFLVNCKEEVELVNNVLFLDEGVNGVVFAHACRQKSIATSVMEITSSYRLIHEQIAGT